MFYMVNKEGKGWGSGRLFKANFAQVRLLHRYATRKRNRTYFEG